MELNFRLNMGGEDLVIAIAQDWQTNEVLMVAFMNKEAVEQTLKTKKAHYYSTSRQKQWLKGESSGNVQTVKEMYIDCDADAIIMKVEQIGAACHEGYRSCFFRQIDIDKENIDIDNLTDDDVKVISERLFDPKEMYG
ncbi:MAG: phosphoribosyl-AMP cyclohydrolase [Methanobrevibacter sp.]|nr:phosphoribosyl-AMP cyclohydrolase [Methanobrevibacter sp.]MBO6105121.1 phosphoribosyl-AMP cyclohydrolase [Methanobrevibacter sp.]MBO7158965.1 phosphoribosyl-AMP cyclohydrolase [Methanobrevibacter sp.]MBP5700320.1 phosphoribosyl-AMP cyclohydrolase [Methanobrevibacter sp.]